MTPDIAERQIIQLETDSEELEVDVYRMPSGEIRVGASSIGRVLGYTDNWLKRIVGSPSRMPKTLQSLGFTGRIEKVLTEGAKGNQEVQTVSLEDFGRLVRYGVLNGKKSALAFLSSKASQGILASITGQREPYYQFVDFIAGAVDFETLRCAAEGRTNESSELYELDFYGWTQQQAKVLQEKKWSCLDIPNLVEEIESLGKQQQQELENRLGVLLGHLLKWEFQPENRSRSWFATIREQRRRVLRLLKKSPSLQPYLPEALESAYQDGLDLAVRETSLAYKVFPQDCPYSLEQTLDFEFFPGEQLESAQDWD